MARGSLHVVRTLCRALISIVCGAVVIGLGSLEAETNNGAHRSGWTPLQRACRKLYRRGARRTLTCCME
jgi:hypothetical protein